MKTIESFSELPTRINLRKEFPVAFRSVFMRSFIPLVLFFALIVSISLLDRGLRSTGAFADMALQVFDMFCMLLFAMGATLLALKLVYELLFYLYYSYEVETEHLVITKGIIFRARASVPIAKINDVSLARTFVEMLFNLYHLRIMSPSPLADLTVIHGLPPRYAVGLQNRLLSLVETTLPAIKRHEAETVVPAPEEQEAQGPQAAEGDPSSVWELEYDFDDAAQR